MVQDVVFQWLTTDNIHLNQIDAEDPEVREIWIHTDSCLFLALFHRMHFY